MTAPVWDLYAWVQVLVVASSVATLPMDKYSTETWTPSSVFTSAVKIVYPSLATILHLYLPSNTAEVISYS